MGNKKKCQICGRFIGVQGWRNHTISCQKKHSNPQLLSDNGKLMGNILQKLDDLTQRVEILESLVLQNNKEKKIEKQREKQKQEFYEILKDVCQLPDIEIVNNNIPLYQLVSIFEKDYKIPEDEFRSEILRLYRKQKIDLQPGGSSEQYQLKGPGNMKFYYLIMPA